MAISKRRSTQSDQSEDATTQEAVPAEPVQDAPSLPEDTQPVHDAPSLPEEAKHRDDTDVQAALERDTQDGKGEGEVPPSDFISYATEDVEAPQKSVPQIASEVLTGLWGGYGERRNRLQEAGYDPSEVQTEVNRRLAAGAPSGHTPSVQELALQVLRGEWGEEKDVRLRLKAAGFRDIDVLTEVEKHRNG